MNNKLAGQSVLMTTSIEQGVNINFMCLKGLNGSATCLVVVKEKVFLTGQ